MIRDVWLTKGTSTAPGTSRLPTCHLTYLTTAPQRLEAFKGCFRIARRVLYSAIIGGRRLRTYRCDAPHFTGSQSTIAHSVGAGECHQERAGSPLPYPAFSSSVSSVSECFFTISAVIVRSPAFLLPGT